MTINGFDTALHDMARVGIGIGSSEWSLWGALGWVVTTLGSAGAGGTADLQSSICTLRYYGFTNNADYGIETGGMMMP